MDFESNKATFLKQLAQKTEKGEIDWKEDANADSFSVTLAGKYPLRTSKSSTTKTIFVRLFNNTGAELLVYQEKNDEPAGEVYEVFYGAKRKALHVEEALNEVLRALNQA
jgi:hypothetical protein